MKTSIPVGGGGPVVALSVSVRLSHPGVRGLTLSLYGPTGFNPIGELLNRGDELSEDRDLGAGAADCSGQPARFAPGALPFTFATPPFVETYAPDEAFENLSETDAYGRWSLVIFDYTGKPGILHCWSVTLTRLVEVARSGDRRAELSYLMEEDEFGFPDFSDMRLRIVGAGRDIYNRPVRGCGRFCQVWPARARSRGSSLRFAQIDTDAPPELLFDFWSGGASCCSLSRIYDERGGYRETQRNWSRTGYRLVRPPRSRALVFQSGDGRFICVLASCAFTPAPIQLLRFQAGRFRDVTRSHRRLVRHDLGRQWGFIRQMKRRRFEITGALGAWLADKHLLGESRSGWRVVRGFVARGEVARYGDNSRPFLPRLERLLRQTGYIR